jgi:hypothetical protein
MSAEERKKMDIAQVRVFEILTQSSYVFCIFGEPNEHTLII